MKSRLGAACASLVSLALALGLQGCDSKAPIRGPCPSGDRCLEFGNVDEPVSLDPAKITGVWEARLTSSMLEGLTQDDPEGRPVPGMARSWETSPDGKVWTFHLRDANWSDGVPVTADDFVFALRRLLAPGTAAEYASLMYGIKNAQAVNEGKAAGETLGVTAIDPHTLRIELEHPAPYLLQLAKHQTMEPEPRHVVERWGDAWTRPEHYVSNGPYKLQEWAFGDHVRMVKNPAYYAASKVCFDQITYYPTSDSVSAERRIRRGELDVNTDIQSNRIAYLRRPDQIPQYVRTHTWLGVFYLAFNTHDVAALKDRRVRIALSMAVDRDFITHKLQRGGQQPAYGFVPPGVANYAPPPGPVWAGWSIERRQRAARILLAQAGYGPDHPLSLELKLPNTSDSILIAPAIQADWRAIGVRATLAQAEAQIELQDMAMRNFQVGITGWIADYDDPMSFLYLQQSSTGPQNYGDYASPAYDALLAKADQTVDAKTRAGYLARAEAIMLADAPVAPIYDYVNKAMVNPRITGWTDNMIGFHNPVLLCAKP